MGCGASTPNAFVETYPSFYSSYDFEQQLGKGSFGIVYAGKNRISNDLVAVKVQAGKNVSKANLLYEADVWQRISGHPNIVQLFQVCQEADVFFYVMERCLATFKARLLDAPKWTVPEMHHDFTEILHGLSLMHKKRLVHRDVKADNVLYAGPDGKTLKLADFGLTRILEPGNHLSSVCGTTSYMAPEMLASEGYAMPADMWSFGVLCYLTLCGESPCGKQGDARDDVKKAIASVKTEPEKVLQLYERVHEDLDVYKKKVASTPAENQSELFENCVGVLPLPSRQNSLQLAKLAFMDARLEVVSFVRSLLQRNPASRYTAQAALQSPFIRAESFMPFIEKHLSNNLIVNRPPVKQRPKSEKAEACAERVEPPSQDNQISLKRRTVGVSCTPEQRNRTGTVTTARRVTPDAGLSCRLSDSSPSANSMSVGAFAFGRSAACNGGFRMDSSVAMSSRHQAPSVQSCQSSVQSLQSGVCPSTVEGLLQVQGNGKVSFSASVSSDNQPQIAAKRTVSALQSELDKRLLNDRPLDREVRPTPDTLHSSNLNLLSDQASPDE